MINTNTLVFTAAIHQMEDWIAFLEDCKEEGSGEPEEMISFLQAQIITIIEAQSFYSLPARC
jgi:hypothetical protein